MNDQESVIYIVDDDNAVLEALSSLVRSIGLRVKCFSSATAFLNDVGQLACGCLILDVRMPEMSGLDVQRKLAELGEQIPIIFISGHGDIPMAVKAIKAGAIDFFTKPFREEDLLGAIRTALKLAPQQKENAPQISELKASYESLSKREQQVLKFVLQGFLNKQTALELDISEATVKVHRHNIMKKMKVSSVQDLVRVTERLKDSLK
ncbi:TPA: response regulator transcription factor [Pseudomonas aeruginosa]|nr:response regulator transcription factor [Pseudomonas aeruginosa]MBG4378401.1 response regulator transcription factor [Pseudomonas aeruginosa]MBI8227228.1 response regulator transcription factor [Pseudomonas aeruginosa]MCT5070597.1 response regulator transcription factor [Pseudomonas aeruginosa]MDP5707307.1 response regulator transcription factor [Pseudomonas aeruginosa]HBO0353807.1 response regulator transcription factor [Pseudomonas aeruginosa]